MKHAETADAFRVLTLLLLRVFARPWIPPVSNRLAAPLVSCKYLQATKQAICKSSAFTEGVEECGRESACPTRQTYELGAGLQSAAGGLCLAKQDRACRLSLTREHNDKLLQCRR